MKLSQQFINYFFEKYRVTIIEEESSIRIWQEGYTSLTASVATIFEIIDKIKSKRDCAKYLHSARWREQEQELERFKFKGEAFTYRDGRWIESQEYAAWKAAGYDEELNLAHNYICVFE